MKKKFISLRIFKFTLFTLFICILSNNASAITPEQYAKKLGQKNISLCFIISDIHANGNGKPAGKGMLPGTRAQFMTFVEVLVPASNFFDRDTLNKLFIEQQSKVIALSNQELRKMATEICDYDQLAGLSKAEPLQHLVQRGIDLLEGRGVKRDPAAAALLFRQAANQGSALAGSKLASMYWKGIGVPKDLHETFKWAKFAADRGDPAAQRMLGEIYEIGRGVPKDRDEAFRLYKLAAKAGDITAQRLLKRMVKQAEGEKRWARMQNMTFNIVVVCEGDGRSDHDFEAAANLIGWAANHEIIPYQVLINYPQCFEPKRIIRFTDIQALVSSLTIREKGRHFYVAYKDKKNNISYGLIGID